MDKIQKEKKRKKTKMDKLRNDIIIPKKTRKFRQINKKKECPEIIGCYSFRICVISTKVHTARKKYFGE